MVVHVRFRTGNFDLKCLKLKQGSMKNEKNCKNSIDLQRWGSILGKWCRPCTQAHVPHRSQVRYHINIAGSKRKKIVQRLESAF